MAFQNSIRGAARRLLTPRVEGNKLDFARKINWNCGVHGGHAGRPKWRWVHAVQVTLLRGQSLSESVDAIFRLLKRQLHVYASQKLRRMEGVLSIYGSIYAENMLQTLTANFSRRFLRGRKRPFYFLFGGACFVWDREKISDNEIDRCVDDFEVVAELERLESAGELSLTKASWDTIFNNDHLKVWRRPLDDTYLYEYKAYGRFMDISAKAFFQVQMDLEYRKVWDNYVINLDVIDKDEETGSEVIHWVTHYPFPMYSRDYVFTRRTKIDHTNKVMTLVSKAVQHPCRPKSRSHVRIDSYFSQMVIRPHKSFDENGFDFILTYHDDPKTSFPSPCVNWVARSGCPEFLEKLHQAAMQYDNHNFTMSSVRDLTTASTSSSQEFGRNSPGQYSL
ncbi:stAR-related lipid transfer protein 7, mitochondrial-like [Asterias amurensis]|uniref:stAR-related lipid transfer protein 7, mitochondrial-like n=1 Tax=Asterias amurensis TaxID=7602 RepID=UPI003AB5529C